MCQTKSCGKPREDHIYWSYCKHTINVHLFIFTLQGSLKRTKIKEQGEPLISTTCVCIYTQTIVLMFGTTYMILQILYVKIATAFWLYHSYIFYLNFNLFLKVYTHQLVQGAHSYILAY